MLINNVQKYSESLTAIVCLSNVKYRINPSLQNAKRKELKDMSSFHFPIYKMQEPYLLH